MSSNLTVSANILQHRIVAISRWREGDDATISESFFVALIAQLVERQFCKLDVRRSNRRGGTTRIRLLYDTEKSIGGLAEWPIAQLC